MSNRAPPDNFCCIPLSDGGPRRHFGRFFRDKPRRATRPGLSTENASARVRAASFVGGPKAIKAKGDELTAADAALALGVPYHTVLRCVQTGRLTGSKRGGHWYANVAAVAKERARAR